MPETDFSPEAQSPSDERVTLPVLPLSTGVTLYVAASDLIPEVNEERGLRMPLVVFLGVALFYVTEHLLDAFTA